MIFYRVCIDEKPVYFGTSRNEAHDYAKSRDKAVWPYIYIDLIEVGADKTSLQKLLNYGLTNDQDIEAPTFGMLGTTYQLSNRGGLRKYETSELEGS